MSTPAQQPPEPATGGRVMMIRLLRASSLYMLANVASRAVGFLAIPFYSRFLSPAEYGLIELIELSTQLVAIAFGLQSIGPAMTRLFHDQGTLERQREVVSTGVVSSALLSALIAAVAILLAAPLSQAVFRSAEHAPLLQAAFAAMFFANLVEVVLVHERIQERAGFFLAYSLATLFTTLGLNVLFIGFFGAGVWGFVFAKLLVASIGSVYLLWRLGREVGWRWRSGLLPGLARLAAPLTLSGLCYLIIHSSDRYFLASSVTLAEIGTYALAYRFAFLIPSLVGEPFYKAWMATFYRYTAQADWRSQFSRVLGYLLLAEMTAAVALAVGGRELLALMVPPSFYPPPLLLPMLVFAYVVRDVGDFYRSLLFINKRMTRITQIAMSSAALNVVLNILLIPAYGVHGAALATLLTWIAYAAICCLAAWREHKVKLPIRPVLTILAFASGVYWLSVVWRVPSYTLQVLLDIGWMALFFGLCCLFYLSASDRAILRNEATALAKRLLAQFRPS